MAAGRGILSLKPLTITYPDDWHCHLRDGPYLATTVPAAAREFKRVVVMPNLVPPVSQVAEALAYRDRILAAMLPNQTFEPLMVLYLTAALKPEDVRAAKASGAILGYKLYPQGVTTHSSEGIKSIEAIYPLLEVLSEQGLPLLIHGEVNDPEVDIFDREKVFIETQLAPMIARFPQLRMVLEHITTREAVDFVKQAPQTLAATITPHHLLLDRNALFQGGICPHHYCLPLLKRRADKEALLQAAISGNPKFFLGTDSAPHAQRKKETACGCAGIYHGGHAMPAYAQAFHGVNALDKLAGFASQFGPQFYGLPENTHKMTITQSTDHVPESVTFGKETLIPFHGGKSFDFKVIAHFNESAHG